MKTISIRSITIALAILSNSICATAQKLDWSLDFEYFFDNSEFDRSFNVTDRSATLHAARLTPRVGAYLPQGDNITHTLLLGIDLYKDMGATPAAKGLFGEPSFFYKLDAKFRNEGRFTAVAGSFPRSFAEGEYHGAFFDEAYMFEDNNLEGLLFKYNDTKVHAEIALDWMGKRGDRDNPSRRERFSILTHAAWNFLGDFTIGLTGNFYHYACSEYKKNVIDNHTFYPFLQYAPKIDVLDELIVDIGPLISYQRDRSLDPKAVIPIGLQSIQKIRYKGLFFENWFYYGDDMQPYHFLGEKDLYPGESDYHIMTGHKSFIDCFALGYSRKIGSRAEVLAGLAFHFGEGFELAGKWISPYRGSQQFISLRFSLEAAKRKIQKRQQSRSDFPILDIFGI